MSPKIESEIGEKEAILEAAKLMLAAARTAPKTAGIDDILTMIVYGEEKDAIAEKMEEIAEQRKIDGFKRDAKNVRDSEAVVLIGVRGNKSLGFNCGACGYKSCSEFEEAQKRVGQDFIGPTCLFKALDLGIALGSAVKIASFLNIDNRIMYRIGTAALKLNLMPEATVAMGIPLSAKGKNIYFDRKWPP
ncbi:MAG: ferredoxin domain-containing protein [Candidatus Bathyarchaeia archaeon]|mgnify:CR=1 FL=1